MLGLDCCGKGVSTAPGGETCPQWQVEFIGPPSLLQGYVLTAVDKTTGVGLAYSSPTANQAHTISPLQWLAAENGVPSDWGNSM